MRPSLEVHICEKLEHARAKPHAPKQKSPWPPENSTAFWEQSFILLFLADLILEESSDKQQSWVEPAESRTDYKNCVESSWLTGVKDWISQNKSQNNAIHSPSNKYSDRQL